MMRPLPRALCVGAMVGVVVLVTFGVWRRMRQPMWFARSEDGGEACPRIQRELVPRPPLRIKFREVVYWNGSSSVGSTLGDQHTETLALLAAAKEPLVGDRGNYIEWHVEALVRLRGRIPPASQPPAGYNSPRVFCYAVANARDIMQPGFQLWAHAVATACTHWQVFSDVSAPPNITRVFHAAADWNRSWVQHMWPPVSAAWNHVRTTYPTEPPFDWVVKLDLDTYIRPSAFWQLFAGHSSANPLVLSAGDSHCWLHQESPGETDGWFVAVSREAADRIFGPRPVWAAREAAIFGSDAVSKLTDSIALGCPALLSGHAETTNSQQRTISGTSIVFEPDITGCMQVHGIRAVAPLDSNGFGLLMLYPECWFGACSGTFSNEPVNLPWLWSGAPACLAMPTHLLGLLENWWDVFGASNRGLWCYSAAPAVYHPFKPNVHTHLHALIKAGLV
jgi:hypothetical protein